ncbi:MAG: type IV pilus secretin PilQ family protein [Pseudomonadales bacterium]
MGVRKYLAIIAFGIFGTSAVADVIMEDIEFSSLPGGKVEIRMMFDGVPPLPTGYTIEQPARISLDLIGVSSGLSSKYHPLGGGNARSVTVVEAGDRTRVIVSLTELEAYTTRIEGSSLYVLIGLDQNSSGLAAIDLSSSFTSAPQSNERNIPQIVEIDFRRGENGEGRIIVRLSDPGIGIDVSSQGGNIKVEFMDTFIPEKLQRRLDVSDFATPVLTVDSLPESDNSILIITPTGEYDYLAYQADNLFTLEVKPLGGIGQDGTEDNVFRYRGEKLSLNFQDIEIRSVLQLIADFTDLNLVASDTVGGRITLRLKNVPWDQALEIIMKTKGLDKRLVGNVLMIAPAAELAAREKLELESRKQISELAPLRTEFIKVKYAIATEIFDLFQSSTDAEGVLSARGSVIVDERTNSIILTETTAKINEFRQVLDKLDVPVRQVLIEARIVTASSSFGRSIGVRWGGFSTGYHDDGSILTQTGGSLTTVGEVRDGQVSGGPIDFTSPEHLVIDLGVAGVDASAFAVGIVDSNYLLELELSARESEGTVETIARPKVITADKQKASVSSGTKIPYQEASSSGATTTSFAEAVLGLEVRPQITPDDRIIMELKVTSDEVGDISPQGVPSINTNSVETQVLVNNGDTIVLGGIFTTGVAESVTKTPWLGDLPYVGVLFRRTIKTERKQELLIFITPRIIKDSLTDR